MSENKENRDAAVTPEKPAEAVAKPADLLAWVDQIDQIPPEVTARTIRRLHAKEKLPVPMLWPED